MAKILEDKETSRAKLSEKLTPNDICLMKFAPITSMDVEGAFQRTKILFRIIEDLWCLNILNNILLFNAMLKI